MSNYPWVSLISYRGTELLSIIDSLDLVPDKILKNNDTPTNPWLLSINNTFKIKPSNEIYSDLLNIQYPIVITLNGYNEKLPETVIKHHKELGSSVFSSFYGDVITHKYIKHIKWPENYAFRMLKTTGVTFYDELEEEHILRVVPYEIDHSLVYSVEDLYNELKQISRREWVKLLYPLVKQYDHSTK